MNFSKRTLVFGIVSSGLLAGCGGGPSADDLASVAYAPTSTGEGWVVSTPEEHGLDPVHMALAWCAARPFPTIPIFGAPTGAQLDHILSGLDLSLTEEVEVALSKAHRDHPMPY